MENTDANLVTREEKLSLITFVAYKNKVVCAQVTHLKSVILIATRTLPDMNSHLGPDIINSSSSSSSSSCEDRPPRSLDLA